jgi:hypothetical protein
MLPSSVIVILATALLTAGAALLLFWAWSRGWLSDFDAQSRVIFDERDLRIVRPWEDPETQRERQLSHGVPATPMRGEWGGAQ